MGLFTPAWQTTNIEKALKSVEKEINQNKLAKIAQQALLLSVRIAAIEKLTLQSLLEDIALCEKADIETRVKAINKLTNQTVLYDIVKNNKLDFTIGKISEIGSAALDSLNDKDLLLKYAENSDDFYGCIKAYKKLNILPKDKLTWDLSDIYAIKSGANKSALIDYIFQNRIGSTVGLFKVTDDDIKRFFDDNNIDVLEKISHNYGFRHLKPIICEMTKGHSFNNHCICTICGLQEHIFNNSKELGYPFVGSICKRCGGEIVEGFFSYYDGVPGYGGTVSGSTILVAYPDGEKDESYKKYKRK